MGLRRGMSGSRVRIMLLLAWTRSSRGRSSGCWSGGRAAGGSCCGSSTTTLTRHFEWVMIGTDRVVEYLEDKG